jgi:bifunctional UDP-N-acetylglucosamine pyrophosphorylase/glucosamine-1-phosphate N-acetyltransferase
MRSTLPKVLHPVAGRPMVMYATSLAGQLGCHPVVVVVGHAAERVRAAVSDRVGFVLQSPQLGTGHAVAQARAALERRCDRVLVLYGDAPLLSLDTAQRLLSSAESHVLTLLTAEVDDPRGYGRVVRDDAGNLTALVEESEADERTRAIREINSGVICADSAWLWARLEQLQPHANGELYLTDLAQMACGEGLRVGSVRPASALEVLGINDRLQLAQANQVVWERKRRSLMHNGVTLLDPDAIYVDVDVVVGQDTLIYPGTHLRGRTTIGQACEIGPGTLIEDSTVGDESRVILSVVEHAEVGEHVSVGPFSHLRPGAHIEAGVELGNFSEVKASVVGAGSKAHHFSYIGDAVLGKNVNVGAGTITCNFDGQHKHRTTVGDDAFIGSDTMLVAPVTLGEGARTGAGSVVTKDVAPGDLVVGVPARPVPGHRRARGASPEVESGET